MQNMWTDNSSTALERRSWPGAKGVSNILSSCLDLRYPKPDPKPGLLTITRPEPDPKSKSATRQALLRIIRRKRRRTRELDFICGTSLPFAIYDIWVSQWDGRWSIAFKKSFAHEISNLSLDICLLVSWQILLHWVIIFVQPTSIYYLLWFIYGGKKKSIQTKMMVFWTIGDLKSVSLGVREWVTRSPILCSHAIILGFFMGVGVINSSWWHWHR